MFDFFGAVGVSLSIFLVASTVFFTVLVVWFLSFDALVASEFLLKVLISDTPVSLVQFSLYAISELSQNIVQ